MRRYLPLLLALLALLSTATGQIATRELRARRAESEDRRKLEVKDTEQKKLRLEDGDRKEESDDQEDGSGESEVMPADEEVAESLPPGNAADDADTKSEEFHTEDPPKDDGRD